MESASDLNQRIAERVRALRAERGLSLEQLAERSGVSRSMISLIERGECSPTAVVLERLSAGLGVVLASLFDQRSEPTNHHEPAPVACRDRQVTWTDPGSGYKRRNLTPPGRAEQTFDLVEVEFPAGTRVTFDNHLRVSKLPQQLWVLAGTMTITVGTAHHTLNKGDCLAMTLDQPTVFHNPTKKDARYLVAVARTTTP